jgi:exodeoxyribonuclease VII small subunit
MEYSTSRFIGALQTSNSSNFKPQTFQTSNFYPMSKVKLTYTEAVTELETILAELENNPEVNMDAISEKVKRAAVLMEICKKQLHELDLDLEKIMEDLND